MTHIYLNDDALPTDSDSEIATAKEALWLAGQSSAPVYAGEPGPDAHRNGQILHAPRRQSFDAFVAKYRAVHGGPSVGPSVQEIAEWVVSIGGSDLPDDAASFVYSRHGVQMVRSCRQQIARAL